MNTFYESSKEEEPPLPQEQQAAYSVDHLQQELSCRLLTKYTLAYFELMPLTKRVLDFRSMWVETLLSRHIPVYSITKKIHEYKNQRCQTLDKTLGRQPSPKSMENIRQDIALQLNRDEGYGLDMSTCSPLQRITMAARCLENQYYVTVLTFFETHCAAVLLKARPSLNQLEILFKTVCYLYTGRDEESYWFENISEMIEERNLQRYSACEGYCELEEDYECSALFHYFRDPDYFAPGKNSDFTLDIIRE